MEPEVPASTSSTSLSPYQIGNLSISFEGRETHGAVTMYAIRVSGPQGSQVVRRRYNEFAQLHRDMFGEQVQMSEAQAAAMPPKSFFRKIFSKKFRARREDGLCDVAIAALAAAADSDLESCPPALRRFLDLEGLSAMNGSSSDNAHAQSPRSKAPVVHAASNPDEAPGTECPAPKAGAPRLGACTKQEHAKLPRTLSRHHSKQFSRAYHRRASDSVVNYRGSMRSSPSTTKVSMKPSSLRSSWDRYSQDGVGDLRESLLSEDFSDLEPSVVEDDEEDEAEEKSEEEQVDIESGLPGSWMDVSVTQNYAEVFSISQEQGYLELMELAHNGKVHRARFQRKDDRDHWLTATSQARSIRTSVKDLSPKSNLIKLDFEFKSHDVDVWTASQAGKVFSITNEVNTSKMPFSLPKAMAMLIVLVLALMDVGLFMMVDPDMRKRFYDGHKWNPVQTSTGTCRMPPPQPFYLEAGGAMVRTFAISTMLSIESVMSWADEYPREGNRLDSVKAQGLRWYLNYQTASLPLSLCAVLYHWKKAASKDFVCLGAMFVNAPYILNALVSCAQYAIGRQYVRHMHAWSRGAKHRIQRWRVGKGGFMEGKQRWLWILCLTSVVLVGTPTLVIFLCYCLDGLLQPILLVQFLVILSSGVMISWLLGAVKFWQLATGEAVKGELLKRTQFLSLRWEILAAGNSYASKEQLAEATRVSSELAEALARQEEIARFGWTYAVFYFMPIFVSIRVGLEVLFCEITYVHAGLSAWEATEVTWSERRITVFVVSLMMTSHVIIWRFWSSLQLLLECL